MEPDSLEEVFVSGGFPAHSYVDADEGNAEHELRDGINTANMIISLVGPSKCGKTTLCDHVFGLHRGSSKILLNGDEFDSDRELWEKAYAQLPAGAQPRLEPPDRNTIESMIAESGMPVVIDDFHYIDRQLQRRLCQQMKGAAARGVRFVILTIPHRGDDPVRNNPDLSGRFFTVDMNFWTVETLRKIAERGFGSLKVEISDVVSRRLAEEALGSPQLMQTLCLETGRVTLVPDIPFREQLITEENFRWEDVRTQALRSYNYSNLYTTLKDGPPRRGQARTVYSLQGGGEGDVYDVIALALGTDPVFSDLHIDDLRARSSNILEKLDKPNYPAALEQLNGLFDKRSRPLEYDEETRRITVIDPHFYFYLRAKTADWLRAQ